MKVEALLKLEPHWDKKNNNLKINHKLLDELSAKRRQDELSN